MFAELKRTKQKSHMLRPKECGKHGKYFVIVISLPNPFQNKCQSNENKKRLHVFAQKKKAFILFAFWHQGNSSFFSLKQKESLKPSSFIC